VELFFTQEDARTIAEKLGCVPYEGKAHQYFELFIGGKLITRFGVRRASKEKGHGHLPKQLHVTQKQCRDLSVCPLTKEEYLGLLKDKGLLPAEPSSTS
jgi:hypothetical protein